MLFRSEFTVNIALIDGDAPVLGVVHAPALGTTYAGGSVRRLDGSKFDYGKPEFLNPEFIARGLD